MRNNIHPIQRHEGAERENYLEMEKLSVLRTYKEKKYEKLQVAQKYEEHRCVFVEEDQRKYTDMASNRPSTSNYDNRLQSVVKQNPDKK